MRKPIKAPSLGLQGLYRRVCAETLEKKRDSRISAGYLFLFYFALCVFAPCKPAAAQGFDIATGTNTVSDSKDLKIADKAFTFSRNITATGTMSRLSLGGTIESVGVTSSETNQTTILSVPETLHAFFANANHSRAFGADFTSSMFVLDILGAKKIDLGAPGGFDLAIDQCGSKEIKVTPQFKVEHDFGNPFGVPIGKKEITFDLEVIVKVEQCVKGKMAISFPAEGIDQKGKVESNTTATVSREVKIIGFGVGPLKIEARLTGEAKFDFSKTVYEVDAKPRFDDLKGEASSKILPMNLVFGGDVSMVGSVTVPVVGDKPIARIKLLDLPQFTFTAPAKNKVLYKR